MRRFRIFAVFLLLAVWLTAKEHCNLEATGVLPDTCESDCGESAWKNDGCGVVENGAYKQAIEQIQIAPPQPLLCFFLVPPEPELVASAPPAFVARRFSEPQTLVRTWQFLERAAPPSRAPAMSA